VNRNALWWHEVLNRHHLFSKHYNFPAKNSVVKVKSRMKLTSHVSCVGHTRGEGTTIFGVKYSIIRTKSNFNLFTLDIFVLHTLFDPTTIVNNNFCPLNILKSTKMKCYFVTYRNTVLRANIGKIRSCLSHWAVYTYSTGCLSVFLWYLNRVQNLQSQANFEKRRFAEKLVLLVWLFWKFEWSIDIILAIILCSSYYADYCIVIYILMQLCGSAYINVHDNALESMGVWA
jgi:hypothetical protein